MRIELFKRGCVVIADNLSWKQVLEAEEKALASEAAKYYHFYRHPMESPASDLRPWSLLAMAHLAVWWNKDKDVSGWVIEIRDFERQTP